MTNTEKRSISATPIVTMTLLGYMYFCSTLLVNAFSNIDSIDICWEAGILGTIGYGFIYIRNFLENAHHELMQK